MSGLKIFIYICLVIVNNAQFSPQTMLSNVKPMNIDLNPAALTQQWENFKKENGKNYERLEEILRFDIFKNNLKLMFEHNQKFLSGLVNYHIGINQFADMTKEEFVKNMLKVEMPRGRSKRRIKEHERFRRQIVDRIDWRERGAVTPVKNQGNCGSCWSFSAIGSVEGQYFLKTGNLVSLSEQNLLDCATDQNRGCNGGWMTNAFDYLKGHTITSEDAYPYYAQQQQCQSPYGPYRISIQGYETISNEGSLQQAVATTGPISAAMDASNLQFYAGGVFRDDDCNSNSVNHGVLVVGYGSESGRDYWLVKNSWGPKWGEEGYFKIVRNRNNQCGIASYGMYPIL